MSLANFIRILIVLALSAHVFIMYSFARAAAGTVGFDVATTVQALLFAMILMLPFVWALGIADVPDLYQRYVRPARRWNRGACPACGYDLRGHGATLHEDGARGIIRICPECGGGLIAPEPYRYSWSTVRRFGILMVLAIVIGAGAGEAAMLYDEHRFADEARAGALLSPQAEYSRPRMWPNGAATLIDHDGGTEVVWQ